MGNTVVVMEKGINALLENLGVLDEILRNEQTPISDSLTGILAHIGDITAEQIREERLSRHLQGGY